MYTNFENPNGDETLHTPTWPHSQDDGSTGMGNDVFATPQEFDIADEEAEVGNMEADDGPVVNLNQVIYSPKYSIVI